MEQTFSECAPKKDWAQVTVEYGKFTGCPLAHLSQADLVYLIQHGVPADRYSARRLVDQLKATRRWRLRWFL
jgi:hypothetical protein